MAKLKKNYSINSAAVELLDELAERLNIRQGDLIAQLVCGYGVALYDRIIKARAEDIEALAYLSHLADCATYELEGEYTLAGEEEAVDGAE